MTTYDEIYESFEMNTDFNSCDVPQNDEARYVLINKAVAQYNRYARKYNRIQYGVRCNDLSEELTVELSNDELLVLIFIMAEIIANRSYTSYCGLYSTYSKELGISNYSSTANHRKSLIEMYKQKYLEIIEDQIDSFIMTN